MTISARVGLFLAGAFAVASPAAALAAGGTIAGVVKDGAGRAVAAATVSLLDGQQTVIATTRSDASGGFSLQAPAAGSYLLSAAAPGLVERRVAVTANAAGVENLTLLLEPPALSEQVTVTADAGRVDAVDAVAQAVNVLDEEDLGLRAKSVVAQLANEEAGIHLQRTSPSIAGVFVRGLTGAKVSVFVDGQRLSTAAARGGINTFLDLIDPATLEAVEVLRGPSSAQYGSDALGGSVQFLTRAPEFATDGPELRGSYGLEGGSADNRFGGHLSTTYAARRICLLGTLSGRRIGTQRAADGVDSRGAVTRFLGLDSGPALGEGRLTDTDFSQYGGQAKLQWAMGERSQLAAGYTRSQQDGAKRYDQLLGGDGNLVADLRNLMLDRASLRYTRWAMGVVDRLSLGYSLNSQREERVNQGGNGNPRAAINHEYERTTVHGVQASASKDWGRHALMLGGDLYRERVTAPSFGFNPVTGLAAVRRGRVPDGARYTSGGVFVQDVFQAVPERLRLAATARWSGASYRARAAQSPLVGGRPLWLDDDFDADSLTFRAGAVVTLAEGLSLAAHVGRGFRAPHITDLGTLGLTGSGFEVSPASLAGLAAGVGATAGADAVATGAPVRPLEPERSLSYEASLRVHRSSFDSDLTAFVNDIDGNIQKQALILPAGAVGTLLGDQPIIRQAAGGAVFVAAASNPVLVNANFDDARIWGIEHTLSWRPTRDWTVATALTYLHAEDRRTGRPPNIEGGTPAADGWLKLRWSPQGRRFWVESYLHGALRQSRLSSLDLEDRRTGATRTRGSIANFFNNGARARGLVGPGADGVAGNADDVLIATGETLARLQDRVLGPGVSGAPLFTALPAYLTVGLRGGLRLAGGHELLVDLENLTDRSYRGVSWGMDAPGRGVSVRYLGRF